MSHAVDLRVQHVPAEVCEPLEAYLKAAGTASELQQRLANTPRFGEAYPRLAQQHADATAEAEAAHAALIEATRANARRMREYAADYFAGAVDRARGAVATAEAELRDAAAVAALFASIHDGRPTLNSDTQAGRDSKPRQRAMLAVSLLRDIELPEDLDD